MYLHVWERGDDDNGLIPPHLFLMQLREWNRDNIESLILELARDVPHLAETFYALSLRDSNANKREQRTLAMLVALYFYGGLYIAPTTRFSSSFNSAFPFDSTNAVVSARDDAWAFFPSIHDTALLSALTAYAKTRGKGQVSIWNTLQRYVKAPRGNVQEVAENAFTHVADVENGEKDKDDVKVKEDETNNDLWSFIKTNVKTAGKMPLGTKILLGFIALVIIATIAYFVWRSVAPKSVGQSKTMTEVGNWVKRQLSSFDSTLASSASRLLDGWTKKSA